MRPERAFIMPRSTARESTKIERRLAACTSSHSSSFMRASRLSRVMPALFTRIATGPWSFCTASMKAPQAAASRTSSTRPAPFTPACAKALPMPSAPLSEVDVPTTVAPARASAMAMPSPMPREAPVTTATCPSSFIFFPHGGVQRGRVLDGDVFDLGRDALRQAHQHPARAALDDAAHATGGEELHRLDPAHRMVELGDEGQLDTRWIVGRL